MGPIKEVWDEVRSLGPGLELHVRLVFTGISWKDKVADLRLKMAERNIVWFVVTALDEIACKYAGFTIRTHCPISWFSGNLCGHAIQL